MGETNVRKRENPRSGSKAKDGKEKRPKVGKNNGQLRIANATTGGARKPPGPTVRFFPFALLLIRLTTGLST